MRLFMGDYEYTYLAQAYGSGEYGNCSYATSGSCSMTTATTSGGGSPLANTGLAIALIVTLACVILLAAVLVRWWRRPRRTTSEAKRVNGPIEKDQ
jgi:hypothetical protein